MKSNTFLLFVVIASVSPFENGTPSEKGHKHRRIETIPVDDDNLLQPEIPEAVEEMLANVRIAPNVNTGRQRRTGKKYPWPSLQSQQVINPQFILERLCILICIFFVRMKPKKAQFKFTKVQYLTK